MITNAKKKRGQRAKEPVRTSTLNEGANSEGQYLEVPIEQIVVTDINPRRTFDEARLQELTASVKAKGVLEPLLARRARQPSGKGKYELVAGERRLKAAKRANLTKVAIILRDYSDQEALEIAVVENEQRDDVPILEKGEGYRRLMKEYGYSAEALAARIHKSEAHVHSTVKLLIIPDNARKALNEGVITKSGTNEFHGSGFYFFRNKDKNPAFFFFNYEQ